MQSMNANHVVCSKLKNRYWWIHEKIMNGTVLRGIVRQRNTRPMITLLSMLRLSCLFLISWLIRRSSPNESRRMAGAACANKLVLICIGMLFSKLFRANPVSILISAAFPQNAIELCNNGTAVTGGVVKNATGRPKPASTKQLLIKNSPFYTRIQKIKSTNN